MRRLAITNQKGGSAKTTTAVNLAAALAEKGRSVLVIDLDPQANCSTWLGAGGAETGAYELLTQSGAVALLIQPTAVESVAIIPANPSLNGAERVLAREVGAEMTLRRRLSAFSGLRCDYLLIDTPPTLGLLTLNALAAADELIVPVEAHVLALAGVAQLFETVRMVNERLNPNLTIAGIVACRVDSRTRHASEVTQSLRNTFGDQVFETEIRENIRLAEAPSFKQPITSYDPRSSGAADYRALASEVLRQEERRAA